MRLARQRLSICGARLAHVARAPQIVRARSDLTSSLARLEVTEIVTTHRVMWHQTHAFESVPLPHIRELARCRFTTLARCVHYLASMTTMAGPVFSRTVDTFQGADGSMTTLAMALECCMLMDDAAQARYAAIYGYAWESLSDIEADYAAYELWTVESAVNTVIS